MPFTQADLVREVLAELGALDASNTPSPEDGVRVTTRIPGILAALVSDRIVPTFDVNAIPDAYYSAFIRFVAERMAPSFGRPTNKELLEQSVSDLARAYRLLRTGGTALARAVLERLETLQAGSASQDIVAVGEAIERTLVDLRQRRVIDIPNAATVPVQQFDPLVTLVTYRANQKAVPPEMAEGAELQLLEIDRLDRTQGTGLTRLVLETLSQWGGLTPAVDRAAVSAAIPGALLELGMQNVAYFSEEGSITPESMPAVARYIAAQLHPKPDFALMQQMRRELRLMQPPIDTGPEPVEGTYF